jgi:hypothetical protein
MPGAGASLATVGLLAIMLVSGILACGGDDKPSADLITPQPKAEGGTIEVPADLTPPPEVTPPSPTYIEIRGQQVPLAPGMSYGRASGVSDVFPGSGPAPASPYTPRLLWKISYNSDLTRAGFSWVYFDDEFNLVSQDILPEDQDEFQPILEAIAVP